MIKRILEKINKYNKQYEKGEYRIMLVDDRTSMYYLQNFFMNVSVLPSERSKYKKIHTNIYELRTNPYIYGKIKTNALMPSRKFMKDFKRLHSLINGR